MKKLSSLASLLLTASLLGTSCSPKTNMQYSREIECISSDGHNSQVLAVWCGGKDNFTTCDNAVVRVVDRVIFTGTTAGISSCGVVPLVLNPNARKEHESYFTAFFDLGGKHKQYAVIQSYEATGQRCQARPHQIFVRVNTQGLLTTLKNDKIKIY